MAVTKKDFIDYMAANGCKTKKSCKKYLDLMLDTFYIITGRRGSCQIHWNYESGNKSNTGKTGKEPTYR